MNSDKQAVTSQHVATHTEEDNKQQETDNSEKKSSTFTPAAPTYASTKVDTSNCENNSLNAEQEKPEEEEQTSQSSTERRRATDSQTTEAGQVQGGT